MSQGRRFKFIGSEIAVQNGFIAHSPPQAVSAITKAFPAHLTAAGSDYDDGAVVKIANVVGMVEINGQLLVVDEAATGAFDAANIDSEAYTAYTSGGTLQEVLMTPFCECTGVNQQDGTADQIEVTTVCSTAKEFETGLSDSGTIQLDYNFAPLVGIQLAMRAAKRSGDLISVRLKFPNAGGIILMFGTVQQQSFQGSVSDAVWKGSATLRLSGEIYVLEGGNS